MVFGFLQVRRNEAKMHSMWYHFVFLEWPCRTELGYRPVADRAVLPSALHRSTQYRLALAPSVFGAAPQQHTCSRRYGPPICLRLYLSFAARPRCRAEHTSSSSSLSWRFAGQACASSSPSRDGSRNSGRGALLCSGKALLGGWSAGCGLIGAWSVVGGVTAGAGAGGSRGRSVKPACCHATGSDDCCVASVYVVSSAAGGVERGRGDRGRRRTMRCRGGRRGRERRHAAERPPTAASAALAAPPPSPRVIGRLHARRGGEL